MYPHEYKNYTEILDEQIKRTKKDKKYIQSDQLALKTGGASAKT
jgi:hypothetical protein